MLYTSQEYSKVCCLLWTRQSQMGSQQALQNIAYYGVVCKNRFIGMTLHISAIYALLSFLMKHKLVAFSQSSPETFI